MTSKTGLDAAVLDSPQPPTTGRILRDLLLDPWRSLILRWNWKSAVFSSLIRANIFFFVTLRSGWHAALGAFTVELAYRALTSGFYGALTQSFSEAEPAWAGAVTAMILLPLSSHSIEFAIHSLRHTPHLAANLAASVGFTVLSSLFNWYAMRNGSLVVGGRGQSIGKDMQSMPLLIGRFLAAGPRAVVRCVAGQTQSLSSWAPSRPHGSEDASPD